MIVYVDMYNGFITMDLDMLIFFQDISYIMKDDVDISDI